SLHVESRVLLAEGKKLRLLHAMKNDAGELLATGEHLLIHVNLQTRRSSMPAEKVLQAAAAFAKAHDGLPPPDGV
ncbi:MAG: carnitine 3-dehydrogenase, partial [Gammaproteobacteria bacterium]